MIRHRGKGTLCTKACSFPKQVFLFIKNSGVNKVRKDNQQNLRDLREKKQTCEILYKQDYENYNPNFIKISN